MPLRHFKLGVVPWELSLIIRLCYLYCLEEAHLKLTPNHTWNIYSILGSSSQIPFKGNSWEIHREFITHILQNSGFPWPHHSKSRAESYSNCLLATCFQYTHFKILCLHYFLHKRDLNDIKVFLSTSCCEIWMRSWIWRHLKKYEVRKNFKWLCSKLSLILVESWSGILVVYKSLCLLKQGSVLFLKGQDGKYLQLCGPQVPCLGRRQ